MTDPLDDLKAALKAHVAPVDESARARAIATARENFEAHTQGTKARARPISDRPHKSGIWKGLHAMTEKLFAPRFLMGTSAIATIAIAVALTSQHGRDILDTGPLQISGTTELDDMTASETSPAQPKVGTALAPASPPQPAPANRATPLTRQQAASMPQQSAQSLSGLVSPDASAQRRERRNLAPAIANDSFADGDILAEEAEAIAALPAPEPIIAQPESDTERYPETQISSLKRVVDDPVSTFSIDVDTSSYSVVRSSLTQGLLPPKAAVRIEEMVNYFDYDYRAPASLDTPFETSVSVAPTPWNPDTQLLHIGIQGYDLPVAERPPLNLVFLIDTSGSMNDPAKLPLLLRSFGLLLDTLRPEDQVAIVTYAGSSGLALEPTDASQRSRILGALDHLSAGGSTAGQAGLQQAYQVAEDMAATGEVSRVILATDGDFNVGLSDPSALEDFIAAKRKSGTYLSVLGFGRGNYNDAVMQSLAQNGNGTAAYIDTLGEAQKVLVQEASGALFPIAGDVKIQIEFNPAQISEYRLIGYETRALNREDFNNDAVDAGEIGAGHTVTALYEVTPTGSPAERLSDLRYAQAEQARDTSQEYAFLKLRYKRPGEDRSTLIETPVLPDRADIPAAETRFAAAVAGFGELLRGSTEISGWTYDDALVLASGARGDDPFGYRAGFMELVRLAKVAR